MLLSRRRHDSVWAGGRWAGGRGGCEIFWSPAMLCCFFPRPSGQIETYWSNLCEKCFRLFISIGWMCIFDGEVGVVAADFRVFHACRPLCIGVCPLHFWDGTLGIAGTLHARSWHSGLYWDGFIVSSRLSYDREVVDRTLLTTQSVPQPRHGSWGRVEDTAVREQPVGTSLHVTLVLSGCSNQWHPSISHSSDLQNCLCRRWPAGTYGINVKKQPHEWVIMMIRRITLHWLK